MENQIKKNMEILREQIKELGNGEMNYSVAQKLVVCGEAYNVLRMAAKDWHHTQERVESTWEESELSQAEISEWMANLQNEDGTRGPHYTKDQVEQHRQNLGINCDVMELYAATNMMYSDYCRVLKKYGVDRPEVYVEMAKAFLDDKDAGAKDKLAAYYEYIVEGK